jgi:chromosome segregation ATPase
MEKEESKEEFELIPISPLRRLEKRVEELETTRPSIDVKEFFRELIDLIKMNQRVVDQLARSSDALRIELSKLPGKIDELVKNLSELITFIRASAAAEEVGAPTPAEAPKPLLEKLDQIVEGNKRIVELSQTLITALEEIDKKLKRPPPPPLPPLRKRPSPLPRRPYP